MVTTSSNEYIQLEQYSLPVTEKIIHHFFLIRIPYFLNFNFKNLENCLLECKKNNLIE